MYVWQRAEASHVRSCSFSVMRSCQHSVRRSETPAARPRYLTYACMTALRCFDRDIEMLLLIYLGVYIGRTRRANAERHTDLKIVKSSTAA